MPFRFQMGVQPSRNFNPNMNHPPTPTSFVHSSLNDFVNDEHDHPRINIPETNELYQPVFYPSTHHHQKRRDHVASSSMMKPHADFYVDQVKQILVEGSSINRAKSKTLVEYSDPTSEGFWDKSHTFQFSYDNYLYIFLGAHAWHHYYRSIKDDCLFRISLFDIDNLYEGIGRSWLSMTLILT